MSVDEIVERLHDLAVEGALTVYAPLVRNVVGSHKALLELLVRNFWSRCTADRREHSIHSSPRRHQAHTTSRYAWRTWTGIPLYKSVRSSSRALLWVPTHLPPGVYGDGKHWTFPRSPVCSRCGAWFEDILPLHFHTSCPFCSGDGCRHCDGTGLHPQAAAVRWQGLRLPDLLAHSVADARTLFIQAGLPASAQRLLTEIEGRLDALYTVGLGYVTLDRTSPTLSRGEAQRVRLAVALTSRLEDLLHVLDEPTIGQHPADVMRLMPAFRRLSGPVVYVEHDRSAAAYADHAIDLGPGAGEQGGQVIFTGTPADLWNADTPTGRCFSMRARVPTPQARPAPKDFLTIRRANLRNLQDIDVPIPLGCLTVISGVSGSGKSTLVEDVLVSTLISGQPTGCQRIDSPAIKPVLVDQSPIGKNPRSNPATYTKLSDIIAICSPP
jgi:excinuclease ABC subunit A